MAEASVNDTQSKLEVMARFDQEALGFDFERTAAGYRLRHRLVKSLVTQEYRPDSTALDVGCGTGEYALMLAQVGFDVVGGDLSKGMLAIAKSKIKKRELSQKIQLVRLESTELPFRKDLFDTITCIALLDQIPDPHRLLVEANRVLKCQANLIVCVDALWSRSRRRYARIFGSKKLQQAFTACGFVVKAFFGDILLAQVFMHLLFDPKRTVLAAKVLEATQPLDRRIANLPLLRSLSAHYIIEAKKK